MQRSSYADLREMEKNNEYLMSGLDEYLKELDEMRVLSMSFPLRDRNAVNRKVEELHRRRLKDVRELSEKIKDYENHLAEEKEFYESLK